MLALAKRHGRNKNYAQAKKAPAIALYYQHNAPLEDLESLRYRGGGADHGYDPLALRAKGTELYAYVGGRSAARGPISRTYRRRADGPQRALEPVVVDQTPAQWPAFLRTRW